MRAVATPRPPLRALILLCGVLGLAAPAARAAGAERVTVFYPAGGCPADARLEIEVWDRTAPGGDGKDGPRGAWRPHPDHPRIAPDSCASEDPGILLNEIRVRCVDPAGAKPPSAWVVGADVFGPGRREGCPPPHGR